MPAERSLTLGEASRAIASLALRRALRRRAVWIALGFAVVPGLYALITVGQGERGPSAWPDVFGWGLSVLAIVPPMLVAGAVGEDLDDRTVTYLWSRPLPRVSLVTGTVLAMAPLAFAVVATGLAAAFAVTFGGDAGNQLALLARSLGAVALGVAAVSAAAAALATLSPRFGTALAVCYVLLLDLPLGLVPLALRALSITHQVREIAIDTDPPSLVGSVVALAALGAAWAAVALWRIGRRE